MTFRLKRRSTLAIVFAGVAALTLFFVNDAVCVSAWVRHGVALRECPDGKVRPTYQVNAEGLRRNGSGTVSVVGLANYTRRGTEWVRTEPFTNFEVTLSLVDADGKSVPVPLAEKARWEEEGRARSARVSIPQLTDGEYTLRAAISSRLGDETVDVPVGFFAPARVHVLTDRPLYEPGQQILFRSVVLRAQDLSPLEGRPGRWTVIDPQGETVLEEKRGAGPWGVAAGSFPLDRGAPTGDWRIRWTSGDATDEAVVRVEPFTVPRFRVDASSVQSFYGPGDRPVVKGAVVYASGAPVANATLELAWTVQGNWPQPVAWREGALPKLAKAGRDGRFTLELPEVPFDLRGRNTLAGSITAIDAAGDRVSSFVPVLLSEDALQVETVTELGDGLVEGFNNRMYVRATRADGLALAGATLKIKRAWDAKDPGITAVADEDGVASVQIDPGVAVNVVVPPMPHRRPAPQPRVHLREARDLIAGADLELADQLALERSLRAFESCSLQTLSDSDETIALRVGPSGAVTAAVSSPTPLGRCLAEVGRSRPFAAGKDRLLTVGLYVSPADAPYLVADLDTALEEAPEELSTRLEEALLAVRACLPKDAPEITMSRGLEWRSSRESNVVSLNWLNDPNGEPTPAAAISCAQSRLPTRLLLSSKPPDGIGFISLHLKPASSESPQARPQATTFLGYEFLVTATVDGRESGSTRLRMHPGTVPHLRLRPSTVVANVHETVEVQLLRGPSYTAELPKELSVRVGDDIKTLKLEDKKVRFQVPATAKGWLEFETSGARALVYVRTGSDLSVAVTPDRSSYAPGALAHLKLETRLAGKPGAAAVGLFGVDETLGQLAPLPGADSLSRVRPQVAMTSPAFGALDAQALVQGRIRGAHAAAATVLRVSSIPAYAQVDAPVSAQHASQVDASGELTDAFYNVLAELHSQARSWETAAPAGELASPATVAKLWSKALETCEARKEKVTDAFGRKVRLSMLPEDLLALTDPRSVIIAGTRLPEDVENWSKWVAEEAP